jgi:two-component system alkaline phosphatase synthesis response regulator PhoP
MSKKILVVDDEQSISTLLQYNLEQAGFKVITALDGEEGLRICIQEEPDLLVLDLMLPKMDGIEVCKQLRQRKIMVPILMLTAKDDEFDKVLGLELGADDYMTKPFSPREVVARIKAILRRSQSHVEADVKETEESEQVMIGDLKVLPEHYEAYYGKERLDLTPKEFELLVYLSKHKGRVLTRDQLLSAVWNYDFAGDTRIVVFILVICVKKLNEIQKNRFILKQLED